MEAQEKIERALLNDKKQYSDFIGPFYHHGKSELICNYQDCNNFSFYRNLDAFHIRDLSIKADDVNYFERIIESRPGLTQIELISSDRNLSLTKYEKEWSISKRKFFTKSEESFATPVDFCLLDKSHKEIVERSTSDRIPEYYSMAMEYGEHCYAVIQNNELASFIFIGVEETSQIACVNWIYTEPDYREKGYASKLLQNVSNLLIRQGYMVAYQCAEENIASAKTALKSGLSYEGDEIIFERI